MQIGILGLLTIIFVLFKLFGAISWSWWLVLLPLYGGVILGMLIFLIAFILGALFIDK